MHMKKLLSLLCTAVFALTLVPAAFADKPVGFDSRGNEIAWSNSVCTKIQSGLLLSSNGDVLETGFDKYGYNYQAHEFNGTYDSSDRNLDGTYWGSASWTYGGVTYYASTSLSMKWSDDWLSNVDCNGDLKLDRGLVNGVASGTSKGWLTNHEVGEYSDANGFHHYSYFVKIGYVGDGLGDLWGSYTLLQEVYNDPYGGFHGVTHYADPGLGHYANSN